MTDCPPQSELSRDIIKDPYIFELVGLKEKIVEKDIENAMLEQIKTVLLELGKGFFFCRKSISYFYADQWLFNRSAVLSFGT